MFSPCSLHEQGVKPEGWIEAKEWENKTASITVILKAMLSSLKTTPVQRFGFWGVLIQIVTDGRGLTCRRFRRLLARVYSKMGKIKHLKATATCTTEMSQFASILRLTAVILNHESFFYFSKCIFKPESIRQKKKKKGYFDSAFTSVNC